MIDNPLGIEVGDEVQYQKDTPYVVVEITNNGYARKHVGSMYDQSFAVCAPHMRIVRKRAKNYKQLSDEKKEIKMKKCISDVYEKTSEAVLVEKYASQIGIYNDNLFDQCIIKSNKAAFLAEAKRLEVEAKSK